MKTRVIDTAQTDVPYFVDFVRGKHLTLEHLRNRKWTQSERRRLVHWAEQLESGSYEQVQETLSSPVYDEKTHEVCSTGYCCLGVLAKTDEVFSEMATDDIVSEWGTLMEIYEQFEHDDPDGKGKAWAQHNLLGRDETVFSELNDSWGATFAHIAAFIRWIARDIDDIFLIVDKNKTRSVNQLIHEAHNRWRDAETQAKNL